MAIIKDTIELNEKNSGSHARGLIVVVSAPPEPGARPVVGQKVEILLSSGKRFKLLSEEMKDHGSAFSIFFSDLTLKDIPKGSEITW